MPYLTRMRFKKMALLSSVVAVFAGQGAQAEENRCDMLVTPAELTQQTINGQIVYLLPANKVEQTQNLTGCIHYGALLQKNQDAIHQANADIAALQKQNHDLVQQLEKYRALVADQAQLSEQYTQLNTQYQDQVTQCQALNSNLITVADKLDTLSGEYRSIAVQSLSRYRVGAAVGGGAEGFASQLHVGYDTLNLFIHNYDDKTSALIGAELRF
ncbi:MAG: hypothetical protein LRY66_13790 [Saccharospirillaceae bacterium]|nr:hypothetical protein [Saccharospirillaceae bacterium]MCD8532381.1 hypothetical protein [Saccharospirillaceae bacterium]